LPCFSHVAVTLDVALVPDVAFVAYVTVADVAAARVVDTI